jgi:hypothetical protein
MALSSMARLTHHRHFNTVKYGECLDAAVATLLIHARSVQFENSMRMRTGFYNAQL